MQTASFASRIAALLLVASVTTLTNNQVFSAENLNTPSNLASTSIRQPANPQFADDSGWQTRNQNGDVRIDWQSALFSPDGNQPNPWAMLDHQGVQLPVRLLTVQVKHWQKVQPRVLGFESRAYTGELVPSKAIVPRGPDGQPLPERAAEAEPVTVSQLPDAPIFVLRDMQMGDARWVVVAVSQIFQRNGVAHELEQLSAQIDDGNLLTRNANSPENALDDLLAISGSVVNGAARYRNQVNDENAACVNNIPQPTNNLAKANSWKITVAKAGLQSVTGAELAAAGLNTNNAEANKLRLFHNGSEVAIEIRDTNNNNKLDATEELIFYAATVGDRWNASDVYWLATDTIAGLRMTNGTNAIGSGVATANTAFEEGQWRQAKDYDSLLKGTSEDHWFSKDMKTDTNSQSPEASYLLTMTNVLPIASGNISVTVHGTGYTKGDYRLSVKLGSTTSGIQSKTGLGNWSPSFQVNSTANNLTVYLNRATRPSGFWLDKVTWQRPVTLDFRGAGGRFVVPSGAKRYQLTNTSATRTLYDVTTPAAPKIVTLQGGSNTEFQSGSNGGVYVLSGANIVAKPTVSMYAYSNLVQSKNANVIYIAPLALQSALTPLVAHRQYQGYNVQVVEPQLIYDWFSYGKVDPEAIRSFLRHVAANWPLQLKSVTLVGDGTNDPLNYSKKNVPNIIPPYLAEVDQFINETACDTCYVRFSCNSIKEDAMPDAAIGRLPVNTAQQLTTLVNKIVAYETSTDNGGWRSSIAFFADNTDEAGSFELSNERLMALQPATVSNKRMYYFEQSEVSPVRPAANKTWYEYDSVKANLKLTKIISDGNSITNYNGHGNWKVWAAPTLLDINDIDKIKNTNKPTVLLEWTCLAGQFQNPVDGTAVMDEKFLLHPTGGAVLVWAPTGWDVIEGHEKMAIGFYQKLWNSPANSQTMGDLTLAGLQRLSENSCCTAPLWTYTILGDPLTKVRATSGVGPVRPTVPAAFADNSGNGSGGSAAFNAPSGLAMSADSKFVLVADTKNHTIRRIDVATGAITIVAGSAGISGASDGTSSAARFNEPSAIAISSDGKFALVADTGNHAIRKIDLSTGAVTTLAGNLGQSGSTDGSGQAARFFKPQGVAISADGMFALVSDTGNHTIRRINLETQEVTTIAGTAGIAAGINGMGATALFNNPTGIAISGDGTMALVADTNNHTIRRINLLTREVKTVAGLSGSSGSTDGIVPTSRLNLPQGIWLSPDGGYALIADTGNHTVRRLTLADSRLETLLGKAGQSGSSDSAGTGARFSQPTNLVTSLDGKLVLVADTGNNAIRRLTSATKFYLSTIFKLKR
ncbi:MAG: C25 family cysteine peptidase [Anaerolineae bacterium]|nr:C25 family cysteine peptidase [Anaerolineae bacterium]